MFSEIIAPLRSQARQHLVRVARAPMRSLHASSTHSRKQAPLVVKEDPFEEDEDDLFAVSAESTGEAPSALKGSSKEDFAAARKSLIEEIEKTSALPPAEIRSQAPGLKAGTLRKVVEWSTDPSSLDGLGGLLKAWRLMGKPVSRKTAASLAGACIRYRRPDLALEFFSDPTQYGRLTLSPRQLSRLYRAYLTLPASTPLPAPPGYHRHTPDSALWSLLALRHSLSDSPLLSQPPAANAVPRDGKKLRTELGKTINAHLAKVLEGGLVVYDYVPARKPLKGLDARLVALRREGDEWRAAVRKIKTTPVTTRTVTAKKPKAAKAEGQTEATEVEEK